MAAPQLLRGLPLLRLRLRLRLHRSHILASGILSPFRHPLCSSASSESTRSEEVVLQSNREVLDKVDASTNRKSKNKEDEILRDIEPVTLLAKDILHSDRYKDGERLTHDDEKTIMERLLAHHPSFVDKLGCGFDSIMVDRHPQFKRSRCLFVVRTDGEWTDFSYRKCLQEYIRNKYPCHAENFIRKHIKRSSG